MTALAPVAPKIAKLIPRLASNHDGEVIATVHAIRRTLEGAGLDLHALAASLEIRRAADGEPATWEELATWCRNVGQHRLSLLPERALSVAKVEEQSARDYFDRLAEISGGAS